MAKYDGIFHLIVSTTGVLNNKVPPERSVIAVCITVSLFAVILITLIVVACRYVWILIKLRMKKNLPQSKVIISIVYSETLQSSSSAWVIIKAGELHLQKKRDVERRGAKWIETAFVRKHNVLGDAREGGLCFVPLMEEEGSSRWNERQKKGARIR